MNEDKVKLLLVEDNPGDTRLFQEYVKDFTLMDVQLDCTSSLKEAIHRANEHFDVILLDLSLPDSIGLSSLQRITTVFPESAIVILTGLNDAAIAKSAVRMGAQDYLIKGKVDEVVLEKTIAYAIERNKYYHQTLEIKAAHRENEKLALINEQLNRLILQVEKSNSRLEEFAYVATHNLRAPVVNLKSLVELFRSMHPVLEPNANQVFEKIDVTANNLASTLQDLINIIAVSKKNIESKSEVYFEDLVKSIKENLEVQIRKEKAEVKTDFSEVPKIKYPKGHLESICQNMITNSLKYRSSNPPVIEIHSERSDGFICLSFKDNGAGIDIEKHKDKLFRMFQRLSPDGEGKGLGLFIVKSQIERLGGRIEVESEPGIGTTFKVFLKDNPELEGV